MQPHQKIISIHAPREGSDLDGAAASAPVVISIHAPREGSDLFAWSDPWGGGEFQSTLPVRGATPTIARCIATIEFQSTLPVRGATYLFRGWDVYCTISIHAPREGSDTKCYPFIAKR